MSSALEKALSGKLATTFVEELPDALAQIDSGEGLEQVSRDDRRTPRIALAQKMSDEVDADKEKYMEGLKPGDLFNNVTGKIIGRGPLYVTPVKIAPDQIKFAEGRGIECRAYVANLEAVKEGKPPFLAGELNPPNKGGCRVCPHNQFLGGKPPTCDKIWNFVSFLHNVEGDLMERIAVISLKSKGLTKVAEPWFDLIDKRKDKSGRKKPVYTHVYKLTVYVDKAPAGDYYQLKVDNAGWIAPEMASGLEELYTSLRGQNVDVEGYNSPDDEGGF
jgi:hypothetical protein